jgi:hypothetical protein
MKATKWMTVSVICLSLIGVMVGNGVGQAKTLQAVPLPLSEAEQANTSGQGTLVCVSGVISGFMMAGSVFGTILGAITATCGCAEYIDYYTKEWGLPETNFVEICD